jgi:two-component system, cell cycle response regulator
LHVLIADDDRNLTQLLSNFLKSRGLQVTVAYDVMQALTAVMKAPPDAILLDDVMPGGSGLDLLRRLKVSTKTNRIPVVVISSSNDPALATRVREIGADDFLPKPLEFEVTFQTLCRLTGQQELASQGGEENQQVSSSGTRRLKLWERAAIVDIFRRELSRAQREKSMVGVLLVELDQYPRIRDSYGADAAEGLLWELALKVSASIRLYDSLGRYSAEQLMIVLPGSDAAGALVRAERTREAIQQTTFATPNGVFQVTLSMGVTAITGTPEDAAAALEMAEKALRQASEAGGNRSAQL